MNRDFLFRVVFFSFLVIFSVFRATRDKQPKGTESEQKDARLRDGIIHYLFSALFPFWVIVMWFYPFGFSWFQKFNLLFPLWLRGVGIILAAASLVLLWWTHHSLGKHFSAELKLLPDHKLVREGPYRWVRHPMYAAEILIFLSAALISANLIVIIPNVAAGIIVCFRLGREEEMLLERFGDVYRKYSNETGRLLPRISLQWRRRGNGRFD